MEKIGGIEFEWLGPRYVRSKSVGELQDDETVAFLDAVEEQIKSEPYFIWEMNVADLTGLTAATRRTMADRLQRLPDRAIAIVGAQFTQRTLVKLVLTAVALLDKSQRNNKKAFFPDSASAEVWLKDYASSHDGGA